jgi:hypothetical protein
VAKKCRKRRPERPRTCTSVRTSRSVAETVAALRAHVPGLRLGSELDERHHDRCPRCNSCYVVETQLDAAPHFARLHCRECSGHIRFVPGPWTMDRARRFIMPFGQFCGLRIDEILGTSAGRSYLAWAGRELSGNPSRAARVALGIEEPATEQPSNRADRQGGPS